jgi:membrane protease YdiL (CAAX protease family)
MTETIDPEVGEPEPSPAWSLRRAAAWALIAVGVAAFTVEGSLRTGWIAGDLLPENQEVALPRLGWIGVATGLALLAWHQLSTRRSLPLARYRGPSILALLSLGVIVSVALTMPVRGNVNLLYEGGTPDWSSVLIWFIATQASLLIVGWFLVLRPRALAGVALLQDHRPMRHAVIGVGVGGATWLPAIALGELLTWLSTGRVSPLVGPAPIYVSPPGLSPVVAFAAVVTLTPFAEEVFFRGVVLNAWRREYGVAAGLVGSSVLFGLIHFGLNPIETLPGALPGLVPFVLMGGVLGILALRTGTLIAPIAAHATLNAIPLLVNMVLSG